MRRSHRLGWSLAGAAALIVSPLAAWAVRTSATPDPEPPAAVDPALASALVDGAAATDDLVVFVHGTTLQAADDAVARAGLTRVASWDRIGTVVAGGTAAQVRAVTHEPGVTFVERDRDLSYLMETSHQATRYDEVLATDYTVERAAEPTTPGKDKGKGEGTVRKPTRPGGTVTEALPPLDGSGLSIAIVDSGIDATHPLFNRDGQSKVVVNKKLVTAPCAVVVYIDTPAPCTGTREEGGGADKLPSVWVDMDDTDTPSNGGHGTHVAGIAGAYPSETRELHGAAPGAKLVGLSVGQVISVYGGNQGLNWVLENHKEPCGPDVPASVCPPITVVNNSYGGDPGKYDAEKPDATAKLQDALVAAGVTVVWAAGNEGGDGSAVATHPPTGSPTPGVISVANYDDGDAGSRDNALAASSSRGEARDRRTYPDVSAPGTSIISACRITLPICTSGETDPDYGIIGGTSMAAPHVAGYTAVLQQAAMAVHGRWLTPGEIEDVLEDTAYKFTAGGPYVPDLEKRNDDDTTSFDKGHGLVDVKAAVAEIASQPLAPEDPGSPCAGGVVAVDGFGDATEATVDVGVAAATLDGGALVFDLAVPELSEAFPATYNGYSFYVDFLLDGRKYYVSAGRDMFNGEEFAIGRPNPSAENLRDDLTTAGMSGSFRYGEGITIVLTQAALDAASAAVAAEVPPAPALPALADGTRFAGVTVVSYLQRNAVVVASLPAGDTASSGCDYTVGSGSTPAPAPADFIDSEDGGSDTPSEPTTPADATMTDDDTFERSGVSPADNTGYECEGLYDPNCITYALDVEPSTGAGTLDVILESDALGTALDDFDLFLFDAAGTEVASSGNPQTVVEGFSADVESGRYYLVVQPFTATTESPFTVSATLTAA